MNARFKPFTNTITGTQLQKGSSRELWSIRVQVTDPLKNRTVEATSYVTK